MKDFLYFSLYVTESAPKVLPWYAPFIAIMPCLPVYLRANFNAPSTDSAPLFVKNILLSPGGATVAIFSMNLNRVSLYMDMWAVMSVSACFLMAATTLSLQWPTSATPYPPIQSMYSLPAVSHTLAPLPLARLTGNLW